jgi:hypothetical protein
LIVGSSLSRLRRKLFFMDPGKVLPGLTGAGVTDKLRGIKPTLQNTKE